MFVAHSLKIARVLALISSLAACGDSTPREKQAADQDYDFGMWFEGDPARSWFIANGSYESSCRTEVGGAYDSRHTKAIYTFDGLRLAVELQEFTDGACSRPLSVRTLQGRPNYIQRGDGGHVSYLMHKDVGLTVHQIFLNTKDVELLKRYEIPGEWVPESLNSVLHLNEEFVKNKFEEIPDDAFLDGFQASGLMLRLFPVISTIVSMSVRNQGADLMVKSGPGISQSSEEVRFKRRP